MSWLRTAVLVCALLLSGTAEAADRPWVSPGVVGYRAGIAMMFVGAALVPLPAIVSMQAAECRSNCEPRPTWAVPMLAAGFGTFALGPPTMAVSSLITRREHGRQVMGTYGWISLGLMGASVPLLAVTRSGAFGVTYGIGMTFAVLQQVENREAWLGRVAVSVVPGPRGVRLVGIF